MLVGYNMLVATYCLHLLLLLLLLLSRYFCFVSMHAGILWRTDRDPLAFLFFSCWLQHVDCIILVATNLVVATSWLRHVGCSMLVAIRWLQHVGCNMLVATWWLQLIGCKMLAAMNWLQHVGLVGTCWLDATCWLKQVIFLFLLLLLLLLHHFCFVSMHSSTWRMPECIAEHY